jgi:hypothetical protein
MTERAEDLRLEMSIDGINWDTQGIFHSWNEMAPALSELNRRYPERWIRFRSISDRADGEPAGKEEK